jgi:hypothetical protein
MVFSSFFIWFTPIFLYLAVVRQYQQEQLTRIQASTAKRIAYARSFDPSLVRQDAISKGTKVGHLWVQLIGLSGGDEALAERLVEAAQMGKPLMGDQWYLEKAIHDLISDRSR